MRTVTDPGTIAMLRDSIQRYTEEHYSFLQRKLVLAQARGFSAQAWNDYAEFGWLALRLPEEQGGIDADAPAIGVFMQAVGSRLLMEPLLASTVLGTGLLLRQGSQQQLAAWLPSLADGSMTLACALEQDAQDPCVFQDGLLFGRQLNVLHGDVAGKLIVAAQAEGKPVLCVLEADQVQGHAYRLVDGRSAASFHFNGAAAQLLGLSQDKAASAIALARDEASIALCAETLGVVDSLVETTKAYLKIRKQFGRTLGSNQALQHRMVELYLLHQEVRALVEAAQLALTMQGEERTRLIAGARAFIISAARHIGNEAIQMHGGLGVTEELDVSHYFRRLMVLAGLFGNRDQHFEAFMAAAPSRNREECA